MSLFIREPDVDLSKFSADNRVRFNAYVKLTGKNGDDTVTLPISSDVNYSTDSDTSIYRNDRRPVPSLQGVDITLEGTAGALKRAEGKFICYTTEQFDEFEKALLRPGSDVTIKYGYVSTDAPSDPGTFTGKVYSFDFKYTEQNYIECTFKAVGQGNAIAKTAASTVPASVAKNKTFVKEFEWVNTEATVQTIFDYFDWEIQNATGTSGANQFRPERGPYLNKNYFVCRAPENYVPINDQVLAAGGVADYRMIYVRFGYVIDKLNEFSGLSSDQYVKFDPTLTYKNTNVGGYDLWSCDPARVIWTKGSYGQVEYNDIIGLARESIGTAIIKTVTGTAFESRAIAFTPSDLRHLTNGPENIYISRDELRALEKKYLGEEPIHAADAPTKKQNASLNLEEFLQDIFQVIKKASAGFIDLTLISNPGNVSGFGAENMIIVDRNARPNSGTPTPISFDPAAGDGITRQLLLSGKVPKSIAADAFTKATNATDPMASAGTREIVQNTDSESGDPDVQADLDRVEAARASGYTGPVATPALAARAAQTTTRWQEALATMYQSGCSSEGVAALVDFFRSQIQSEVNKGNITTFASPKYPLELDLTLNGIEGFKFGDLITSKLLPNIYRNELDESKIGFTVTRVSHKIDNNDWTTSLTGTCRLLP